MTFTTLARSGASAIALGIYLAAMPLAVDLNASDGGFGLSIAKAFARDGGDDSGDDDGSGGSSGGGSSGGDDDGSGGSGSSGSGGGGGGGGGDSSGSGSNSGGGDDRSGSDDHGQDDRDDRDDRGGRNGGDDHGDGDRSGRRGGEDDGNDDRSGRNPDDDVAGGRAATAPSGADGNGLRVLKAERSASGIEIVYSNGMKEEIENGHYELKNSAGRTVLERTATSADLSRIDRNVRNSGSSAASAGISASALPRSVPAGSQARRVEIGNQGIEVSYDTGWREEIQRGRYELKDPNNSTVVERSATQADVDRLTALARR